MMTDDASAVLIGAVTIPGTARAAGIAREYVRETVGTGLAALGDLVLCASELVTNAVVHTKSGVSGHVTVRLTGTANEIRLDVTDEGGTASVPQIVDAPLGGGGRGLVIVSALATAWGVRVAEPGTTVWCTVPR
jgi:anti-sigma regulatory factor (Ser/Thr protein kinase)